MTHFPCFPRSSLLIIRLRQIAQEDHHFYNRKKYVKMNSRNDDFIVYKADNWFFRAVKDLFDRNEYGGRNYGMIMAFRFINRNTIYEKTLDPKVLESISSKVNKGLISLASLQKCIGFQENENGFFSKNGIKSPTFKIENYYNEFKTHWLKEESRIRLASHKELQNFRDDLKKDENLKKLKNELNKIRAEIDNLYRVPDLIGLRLKVTDNLEQTLIFFKPRKRKMENRIKKAIESRKNLLLSTPSILP